MKQNLKAKLKNGVNGVNKQRRRLANKNKSNELSVYTAMKKARALYYTMALGGSAWFKDVNEGKSVRAALHTLHSRKKMNVLFKTKITNGGMKIWRQF